MRAFIAIDLPEAVHARLAALQAAFRAACPDARWTKPEGIHLTLKFLGEISDEQVQQVKQALQGLGAFETFSLEVKGLGFFPDARRPRVFWVGIEGPPDLSRLVERVEASMERLGFAREARSFTPHLTLARFKMPRAQPQLQALVEQHGQAAVGRLDVSAFFLFESTLSPRGAEYHKVARFP